MKTQIGIKEHCLICSPSLKNNVASCGATYYGWRCTKREDHIGNHIACGFLYHNLFTWGKQYV